MGRLKISFFLATVFIVCTCIDPYTPKLKGYDSLLTVDALITDLNTSCTVKLTRTMQNQNDIPPSVTDAIVYLTDDAGNTNDLINTGGGIYKTDSIGFKGTVGRTYVLHINTNDGKEYESEPCLMQSVPDIDSIYFEKDQQLINNGTQSLDGISIYLDSKGGNNNQYYRWSYEETWKFRVPYPKMFDYFKSDDPDFPIILPVKEVKEFCWKTRKSDEILIGTVNSPSSAQLRKEPILFIGTDQSDRLLIQYSILICQYSISKNEYDFWNNLVKLNETGSDIFARQPYAVLSNLHCTNNPKERVLGFFQVSAISEKRKNIGYKNVAMLGLHFYSYPCDTVMPPRSFFNKPCLCPPATWDDVYDHLCVTSDYVFTEPIYHNVTDYLLHLVFTRPECANCELSGSRTEPDFWEDLKW